jgi:hypothetical protein
MDFFSYFIYFRFLWNEFNHFFFDKTKLKIIKRINLTRKIVQTALEKEELGALGWTNVN